MVILTCLRFHDCFSLSTKPFSFVRGHEDFFEIERLSYETFLAQVENHRSLRLSFPGARSYCLQAGNAA